MLRRTIAGGKKGSLSLGETTNIKKMLDGGNITDTLPYASNLINSFRKLPAPPTPVLENTLTPNLVNFDGDRSNLRSQVKSTLNGIDYKVANPAVAAAIKAGTLGSSVSGMNTLAQQEANTNANISNQSSYINSTIGARNVERQNNYNQDVVSRMLNQQRLQSENLADANTKYGVQRRDNRMLDLEQRKLDIFASSHKDNGSFDRNLYDQYLKDREAIDGEPHNEKYGGVISYNNSISKFRPKRSRHIK